MLNTFKKFGKIVSIRFRTNTGKSFYSRAQLKGVPYVIAFVYFETVDAAKSSLIMNQEKFHDRVLTVDLDSRDISSKVKPKCTILVGNLKYGKNFINSQFVVICLSKKNYFIGRRFTRTVT